MKTAIIVFVIVVLIACTILWAALIVGSKADDITEEIYRKEMEEKDKDYD